MKKGRLFTVIGCVFCILLALLLISVSADNSEGDTLFSLEFSAEEKSVHALPDEEIHYNFTLTNKTDTRYDIISYGINWNGRYVSVSDFFMDDYFLTGEGDVINGSFTVCLTEEMCLESIISIEFNMEATVMEKESSGNYVYTDKHVNTESKFAETELDKDMNNLVSQVLSVREPETILIPGSELHYSFTFTNKSDRSFDFNTYFFTVNGSYYTVKDYLLSAGEYYMKPGDYLTGSFSVVLTEDMCKSGKIVTEITFQGCLIDKNGIFTTFPVTFAASATTLPKPPEPNGDILYDLGEISAGNKPMFIFEGPEDGIVARSEEWTFGFDAASQNMTVNGSSYFTSGLYYRFTVTLYANSAYHCFDNENTCVKFKINGTYVKGTPVSISETETTWYVLRKVSDLSAPGDVNGDGEISADDLTLIARHVAKIEEITDSALLDAADVNSDGQVDASDLTLLARYVAKIIDNFDI